MGPGNFLWYLALQKRQIWIGLSRLVDPVDRPIFMDYPKPLLDNLNCTCRRLPACQQQPGAARKQHSRGPEPQRDALTRPISQERAARKLCLFRRCGGQLRPVGLSQLFLECGRNPSEVLIKIRPQEAILRLPLVQVVIFRIICHIRPISSRHRQIPCVRPQVPICATLKSIIPF